MMQIVLFLAAVSLTAYLIPVLTFLVRPKPAAPRERPVMRRPSKVAQMRARASTDALDRMMELVRDEPTAAPQMPEPEIPDRSDKIVKIR